MSSYPAPAPRRLARDTRNKMTAGVCAARARWGRVRPPAPAPAPPRPPRHPRNKMIAGVCAGIARRYGISTGGLRLAFVVSCILPAPHFIAHLVLPALLPRARAD